MGFGIAALLDFLRRGGKTSELSPRETVRRTLALISAAEISGNFQSLLGATYTGTDVNGAPITVQKGAIYDPRTKDRFRLRERRTQQFHPVALHQLLHAREIRLTQALVLRRHILEELV